MKTIYWSGIYNDDRLAGIRRIEEGINQYGAITDFKFFSDISMSLVIEIEEKNIQLMAEELTKIIEFPNYPKMVLGAEKECVILLNITFTRATGNLRVEVPAVPG